MKKIIFVSLISFSAIASYADTPYADEKEMSEDVSLLAQSSLLYKSNEMCIRDSPGTTQSTPGG